MITHVQNELRGVPAAWKATADSDLRALRILSDKSVSSAFITRVSIQLGKLRNARFAIAPPFSLPFLDLQVERMTAAFEEGVASHLERYVRKDFAVHLYDSAKLRNLPKKVEWDVCPVFAGIEPQEAQLTSPFEFDEGMAFYYLADALDKSGRRRKEARMLWLFYFHFPLLDRNSAMMLPLFYHEFAHLLVRISGRVPWTPQETSLASCERRVRSGSEVNGLTRAEKQGVRRQWKEELLADCLAVRAVGPAFLFSLVEFASRGVGLVPRLTHPRMALRFDAALRELRRCNHDSQDCNELAKLRYVVSVEPKELEYPESVTDDLRTIEQSLRYPRTGAPRLGHDARVDAYVDELVHSGCMPIFTTSSFATCLKMADLVAGHLVPPTAIYRPGMRQRIDVAAILNVPSVLHRPIGSAEPAIGQVRRRLGSTATETEENRADVAVSRLVQKSLETVCIQTKMDKSRRWS